MDIIQVQGPASLTGQLECVLWNGVAPNTKV